MSVDKKVPEIRFEGFSEEWQQRVFSYFASRVSIYLQSECLPCVEYEDIIAGEGIFNKNIHQKKTFKAGLKFEAGNVVFGKLRPYLKNWFLADFKGLAVGDFWVLSAENVANTFLFSLIQTNGFNVISNLSAGSKMPRSDWGLVSSSCFFIPSNFSESNEIGNYFQKLDTLINQHQKKHDKLCNIKKAMLEKMFPKQGKTIPEIRFGRFSGEWKSDILESVVSFYKGKNLPKSSIQDDGIFPCIHYGELFTKYSEVIEVVTSRTNQNDNFFSISNDVLMPTSDVTPKGLVKSCCIKQSGIILGADILIIRPKDKNVIDGAFLSRFIRSREQQVLQNVTGTTVFHLYASSIEKLDIVFPFIEEQTAISNFFQKLDNLINQHHQQITKLKNIKQACLSKMFV